MAKKEKKGNLEDKGITNKSFLRKVLHRFVPSNFHDIGGLAKRLIFEGKPAGRMAIVYSMAGIIFTPLDVLLSFFEKRLYKKAGLPQKPVIIVCGPPRSGTTLVGQVLMKHLPVYYFNNLTSVFPRSPLVSNKLFSWLVRGGNECITYQSFYGRTVRLASPNDALYLWDRWAGSNRKSIPKVINEKTRKDMISFFGAVEAHSGKPLVNKNNSLNTYAHLVAEILPNAYFICMDRDPVYLAQSHYIARKFIHGKEEIPYGIPGENGSPANLDPVEDICRQVIFHRDQMKKQLEWIGEERFMVLSYEDFCVRPAYWVSKIAKRMLNQTIDINTLAQELPAFRPSNQAKVDLHILQRIKQVFNEMSADV